MRLEVLIYLSNCCVTICHYSRVRRGYGWSSRPTSNRIGSMWMCQIVALFATYAVFNILFLFLSKRHLVWRRFLQLNSLLFGRMQPNSNLRVVRRNLSEHLSYRTCIQSLNNRTRQKDAHLHRAHCARYMIRCSQNENHTLTYFHMIACSSRWRHVYCFMIFKMVYNSQ